MRKNIIFPSLLVTLTILIIVFYQNCGKMQFSEVPPDGLINPLSCYLGTPAGLTMYPTPCLKKPTYLNNNSIGFELSGTQYSIFELNSNDAVNGIPQDIYLYIEASTYQHPDSFVIEYETAAVRDNVLFNVCHVSTWNQAVITNTARPYSTTILQFGKLSDDASKWVKLPKGTTKIKFNFGEITSGNYIGVWNLSDFSNDLTPLSNPLNWRAWVQKIDGAPEEGDQNDNLSGSPSNSFICPAINGDNLGAYGCFSPGNFRYKSTLPARFNDTPRNGDPNQPATCVD